MYVSAIVVAAGRGLRMGSECPKAFLPLAGTPMVVYSLRTLARLPALKALTLVVATEHLRRAAALLDQGAPWPVPTRVAEGGAERQDSVAAGLATVGSDADLVLIHDAARPFVSRACIQACVDAAAKSGAAIAALPARDTVKVVGASAIITSTLDRHTVWMAQTPQVFRAALLREAYARARADALLTTDDAALVERTGARVSVVEGEWMNHKITTPEDLEWAEWYATRSRRLAVERRTGRPTTEH